MVNTLIALQSCVVTPPTLHVSRSSKKMIAETHHGSNKVCVCVCVVEREGGVWLRGDGGCGWGGRGVVWLGREGERKCSVLLLIIGKATLVSKARIYKRVKGDNICR